MGVEPLEIERKYLLDGVPVLPPCAEYRIEQGYFAGDPPDDQARLRRTILPDGSVVHTFSVKRGVGLVRRERQRTISEAEFRRLWPRTRRRRLRKRRYRVGQDDLIWEIDVFEDLDLVLAEVELPEETADAPLPPWLAPHVVREVTEDPTYQNYELARRGRGGDQRVESRE